MNISRRQFVQKGSLVLAGAVLLSKQLLAAKSKGEVTGLQLYSVRDDMRKDPLNTLKQLTAMGYKYVEHANYINRKFYGYEAKEFRKIMDGLGLVMLSGHTALHKKYWDESKKDFNDLWKHTVEDAAIMGQKFVISPSMEPDDYKSLDDFKAFMDIFNKSGELCKQSGMKFGYHNHDFEFTTKLDGQLMFDLILTSTDTSLVAQQLDIGNRYYVGGRALDILNKYPNRFELMHVKDEIKSGKGEMGGGYESTILGKGVMPVKEIIDLGRKIGGTKYFIIEQESYQGLSPLDCVKEDLAVMKKWGY
jgi:sugar phosphate isomerase/epimerase